MVKNQNCVIRISTIIIVYIKTDDIHKLIAEDVETRFDTSSYEVHRQLHKEKNKKVIGLLKDELGGKIVINFFGSKSKTYSYLLADSSNDKKPKSTKKCIINRKLKFRNYKDCLEASQLDKKINSL